MAKRIISIRLVSEVDDNPDTSWIGEYANSPGSDDRTIDREQRGDRERGQYRYFIAANSAAETGCPTSVEEDYKRMETLNRGDWCFIGVYAIAKVQLQEHGPIQTVLSGGLWGIESDSGEKYINDEIGKEQLSELARELKAIGFSAGHIKRATPKGLEVEMR